MFVTAPHHVGAELTRRLEARAEPVDERVRRETGSISPHKLETYSRLAVVDAQQRHDDAIGNFPA